MLKKNYSLILCFLFFSCHSDVADGVIYGKDDRREPFQVVNEQVKTNMLGVGALMDVSNLKNNTFISSNRNFGFTFNLCPTEPYFYQPVYAYCTAFAVNDTTIVSAGHCVENIQNTVFVMDYKMSDVQSLNDSILVYKIKNVRKKIVNEIDFSVLTIHGIIPKERQLKLNYRYRPRKNKKVYVIGHPSGLPMKLGSGAYVRQKHINYFTTNLDTYGGNSGSPVFNHDTHLVEGILVRGETDFKKRGNCYVSNNCENIGCNGEEVVYINKIFDFL